MHSPAFRARRKRQRDARKITRRMRLVTRPILFTVNIDTRELRAAIESAREAITRLFAVPAHMVCIDEVRVHKDRSVFDALTSSPGARSLPLEVV